MNYIRKIIFYSWITLFLFYFGVLIVGPFVDYHDDPINDNTLIFFLKIPLKVLGFLYMLILIIIAKPLNLPTPRDWNSFGILSVVLFGLYFIILYFEKLNESKEKQRIFEENKKKNAKEKKLQKEQLIKKNLEEYKTQKLRQEEEQRAISSSLVRIISDSKDIASRLSECVQNANEWLDEAEDEFKEGTLAPFWDAIEEATINLAEFNECIIIINQKMVDYNYQYSMLNGSGPIYDLGINILPDATNTTKRMRTIVRKAQKNYKFASIYEMRKTNELLICGFNTLGQAIGELQYSIESSLESFEKTMSLTISDGVLSSNESMTNLLSEIQDGKKQIKQNSEINQVADREFQQSIIKEIEQDREARQKHECKELEMLDNIQRKKKPSI